LWLLVVAVVVVMLAVVVVLEALELVHPHRFLLQRNIQLRLEGVALDLLLVPAALEITVLIHLLLVVQAHHHLHLPVLFQLVAAVEEGSEQREIMAVQVVVVLEGRGRHSLPLLVVAIPQAQAHHKETMVARVFLTQQHGVSVVEVAVLEQQQPMYHHREQRQEMAVTEHLHLLLAHL